MRSGAVRIGAALAAAALVAGCAGGTDPGGPVAPTAAAPATPAAAPAAGGAHAGHGPAAEPPAIPLRRGERFRTLSMARPYTPAPPTPGSTDDYRCFLVDPGFTETTFLLGSHFLPQNADVVHHAIFFRVPAGDVAEAKRLDAEAPGDGWTCFGGTGVGGRQGAQLGGAPWIAAWAPGGTERLTRDGTGTLMEPGSQVVMQVHYNLLATGGKATATDRSAVRLRLAASGAKLEPLQTTLLVAPIELPCPPGESGQLCDRDMAVFDVIRRFGDEAGFTVAGLNLLCNRAQPPKPGNTQRCDRTMRQDMVVHSAAGHMHLLGRLISIELNPGKPGARKLLDVPVYDFDDQGARQLPKPVTVRKGDTLRVTCTHDATLRSTLPQLRTLKPRYVVWGEGTSDEMCLGVLVWSKK